VETLAAGSAAGYGAIDLVAAQRRGRRTACEVVTVTVVRGRLRGRQGADVAQLGAR
jgi:hypothetical protein